MARAKVLPSDPAFPHGTSGGVARGCTDEAACPGGEDGRTCRQAKRDYERDYRSKATGVPSDGEAPEGAASPALKMAAPTTEGWGPIGRLAPDEAPAAIEDKQAPSTLQAEPSPKPAPAKVEGRTAAIGATRRLQALAWMGYTPIELAHHTQISVDNIWCLLLCPPDTITDVTHRIIRDRFLKLRDQPKNKKTGAIGWSHANERIIILAESHDWKGPYDWNDIDIDPSAPNDSGRSRRAMLADQVTALEADLVFARTRISELESVNPATGTGSDGEHVTKLEEEITSLTAELSDTKAKYSELLTKSHDEAVSIASRAEANHQTKVAALESTILDLRERAARHDQGETTHTVAAHSTADRATELNIALTDAENEALHWKHRHDQEAAARALAEERLTKIWFLATQTESFSNPVAETTAEPEFIDQQLHLVESPADDSSIHLPAGVTVNIHIGR